MLVLKLMVVAVFVTAGAVVVYLLLDWLSRRF